MGTGSLTKRAHKWLNFLHKDRAGILGSRLSAEKTTAASGAGAACSGMEQGTGGGFFFFPVCEHVCVRGPMWRTATTLHS